MVYIDEKFVVESVHDNDASLQNPVVEDAMPHPPELQLIHCKSLLQVLAEAVKKHCPRINAANFCNFCNVACNFLLFSSV
jgi:hypothetical protein